jgi:sugar lactone lactonase YvrE
MQNPFRTALLLLLAVISMASADIAFVSSSANNKVVRVGSSGTVTDYQPSLNNPRGVAFDLAGNLYVSNFATGTGDGTVLQYPAGGGGPVTMASGLSGPTGLAFDEDGVLYAAVANENRVIQITAPGTFTTYASLGANSNPQGIAFAPDGKLYVANKGTNTISKITTAGAVSQFSDDVTAPTGVAFDSSGSIFAVHGGASGVIARFNPNGKASNHVTGFNDPRGLAIDRLDNFYVVNGSDNSLKFVTPAKAVSTLAGTLGSPEAVAVVGARMEAVAQKGEMLTTDPVGAKFNVLGQPAIAATGHVAFRATLLSGVASVAASNANGIWRDAPDGARTLIARQSFPAPGTNGAVFLSFSDPVVNDTGKVAFRGVLRAGVNATAGHTLGIWSDAGGGPLALVARQGDPPAGVAGTAKFVAFTSVALPEADGPIFLATIAGTGITAANNIGIWKTQPGGMPQLIVRKGDLLPGESVKITGFVTAFKPVAFQLGEGRTSAQDGGVAILATVSDRTTRVLRIRNGTLAVVAKTTEVLTTAPVGAKIAALFSPAIGAAGDVAYYGKLTPNFAGITAAGAAGIWHHAPDNTRSLIARATFPAPGTNGAYFATLSPPAINNAGEVAFRATLKPGLGDAVAGTTIGIWSNQGGNLTVIARQGQKPPGLGNGTKFTAFTSFAMPEAGGEIILALVAGTNITSANNQGIWAMDQDRVLQLVVRKGDKIEVQGTKKTVTGLKLFLALPFVAGKERNYAENGDLAFLATFSDRTNAIMRVTFP